MTKKTKKFINKLLNEVMSKSSIILEFILSSILALILTFCFPEVIAFLISTGLSTAIAYTTLFFIHLANLNLFFMMQRVTLIILDSVINKIDEIEEKSAAAF